MHVTSPAMPLGHAACLYSLCMLYRLICNYKYMFSVTSKSSLDRGVPFSGILNLWNSFFRNSGAGCDSTLLTVTCVQRDCQRKPSAEKTDFCVTHWRCIGFCNFYKEVIFYAWLFLTWMGTESGFVWHERVSSSLDVPSGTSDEQKSSSWLCLFITYFFIKSSYGS